MYPKITSPCPFRVSALPDAERNFCTHCERKVHNLDLLSTTARRDFLGNRTGKVCVAYTVPAARTGDALRAGVVFAAALLSSGVGAQEQVIPTTPETTTEVVKMGGIEPDEMEMVVIGGVESAEESTFEVQLNEPPELRGDAPELEFVVEPKDATRL